MKTLHGAALGSLMILGGFVLACLPPGQRLGQVIRERWTASTTQTSKPEARIDEELHRSEERLRVNATDLAERSKRLRDDQRETADRGRGLKVRERLLTHLLEQFREAFQRVERDNKPSVVVMGQVYEREQLRDQMTVLLRERDEVLADQNALAALRSRLERTEQDCEVKLRETRRHLESMPTYANLVASGKLLDQSRTQLQAMRDILEQSSVFIEKNPIRTVKELLADATRTQSEGTTQNRLDQFLSEVSKPSGPAVQQAPSESIGDVRMTEALRSLNELLRNP